MLRRDQNRRRGLWFLLSLPLLCIVLYGLYRLPPVYSRLSWRVDEVVTRVRYYFNPPDEAIFTPAQQQQLGLIVQATLNALTPTAPAAASATPEPGAPTAVPTATLPPLPPRVVLEGVTYVDQHNRWNYCGPANLTMALNFWGWPGDRDDVAAVVKPGVNEPGMDFITRGKPDKNVMPYEMVDFVNDHTDYRALQRSGGELDLLKRLIAAGFPVVIEKGYYEADYTGKVAWLGHYLFVTGYDEAEGYFIVQDAYLQPGKDLHSPYDKFIEGWRSFNYLFMVVYQPEDEARVLELLGDWADEQWAMQHALDIANRELDRLTGNDQFFAWFNKGTSHGGLQQYVDAAFAYDYAFLLYAGLGGGDAQRPYRIMWYQTGPYWAYYYSGRYQDVIDLANTTLYDTVSEPTLEESIYWRGMARLALGETGNAVADFQQTVYLNPNFSPGWAMLEQLGVSP
ncbi:MAG: C39 family peptidase [Chloroflexi bacterium]|nr:C39 family peptidase [Chloroflexota bacterium]